VRLPIKTNEFYWQRSGLYIMTKGFFASMMLG